MRTVLLLGCDGPAGRNYAKSLRLYFGDQIKIIGTGYNRYQLTSLKLTSLFDDIIILDENMSFTQRAIFISTLILKEGVDFVHAQPEEEVEFLCRAIDDGVTLIDEKTFGKSLDERLFFKDKMLVQSTLGQNIETIFNAENDGEIFDSTTGYWVRASEGAGSKLAMKCSSLSQAMKWAEFISEEKNVSFDDLIISPYLPGKEYAVQIFAINGSIIHAQQRERVEHHFAKQMISGQSSTPSVAVTTGCQDVYLSAFEAVDTCTSEIGCKMNGIYGVDLRRDEFGDPVVTEINYGRYFTTSNFFSTFGVNTPAIEVEYFIDRVLPEKKINSIRDGIYWVRSLDDEPVWYTIEDLEE